jgi:hypothetical protein
MPRLSNVDLDQHKVPTGNFTYSAAKIENLGASEFTLVTIVNDTSGSVVAYLDPMEKTLAEIQGACKKSPRADNLLVRHLQFNDDVRETHGFVPLFDLKDDQYIGSLKIGGSTALFDATRNGLLAMSDYAKKLASQHFMANGILIVVTDGDDNVSACSADDVKKAFDTVRKTEALESVLSILVGIGYGDDTYIRNKLDQFHRDAGFSQFVDQKNADAKTLAKLAAFVSKSISSQSQALGSSGPSQNLTF